MKYQVVTAFCLSLILSTACFAQSEKSVLVKDSTDAVITVTPEEYRAGLRTVVFIFRSKSNAAGSFRGDVLAPAGAKIQVVTKAVKVGADPAAASREAPFKQIMQLYYDGKTQKNITIPGSSSSSGGGSSTGSGGSIEDTCNNNISKQDLDYIIAYDRTHDGYFIGKTRAEICTMLFGDWENNPGSIGDDGGSTGGGSNLGGVYFTAPFHKDACKKNDYVGRVEIDLSKVDASLFTANVDITANIAVKNTGTLTGTYKVSGDGGVPYPILLMDASEVNGQGLVQTWRNGILSKTTTLKLGKFYMQFAVYHTPKTFARQTIVHTDGRSNASNICVLLGAKRVDFGGYHH